MIKDNDDILSMLQIWQSTYKNVNGALENLNAVTGGRPDGPIYEAFDSMFVEYTAALSELVGDQGEWLHWFANDTKFGKATSCHARFNGIDFVVTSVEALTDLILEQQPK